MRYRAVVATLLAVCLSFLAVCPAALAGGRDYTYDEIRNTGIANSCPELEATTRGSYPLKSGTTYEVTELCLQPTSFFVKEEATNKRQKENFVPAKVMTRYTSSMEAISGTLKANGDGSITFKEEDGMDFQPVTVQLPGGERVPLLFTMKGLVATSRSGDPMLNASTDLQGTFRVPSYRTANFLDPKGRGMTTGYESAVSKPAAGDDTNVSKENVKTFQMDSGKMSLQLARIDQATGEIAGTFESLQPSETDMGSREPSEVKIRGVFYGRVNPA
jgi:photosystem II oxygen-evolving enhancer protein 1